MQNHTHETRQNWLLGLKLGDRVKLVTPCGAHIATVASLRDGRLWVTWALGDGGRFGSSTTWVSPSTGGNSGYWIEPVGEEE